MQQITAKKRIGQSTDRSFILLKVESYLFGSLNRCFAEVLHKFAEVQGSLASAGAGSFVTFFYLSGSILLESFNFSIDLSNEFFHDKLSYLVSN